MSQNHELARAIREEPPVIWTTRDGRKLNIVDMDTDHLQNAVAMLEREGWSDDPWPFCGLPPQGDMAQLAYEDAMAEHKFAPWLRPMRNELKRRGIKA